jgi:ACS family hexuronate transporter-like MFS transporter
MDITRNRNPRIGHVRWIMCGLLFLATTINYMDRQVIALLKRTLTAEFKFSEVDYAAIVFSFQLAYAIGFPLAGRIMDTMGTRRGFALAVGLWSVAEMAHAAAHWFPSLHVPMLMLKPLSIVMLGGAVAGFVVARFALGIAEAGNFPACVKTAAEWFPLRERAFATGIMISGGNVGAILAPLSVPWITARWGWQWTFIITGAVGFVWLVAWLWIYRAPGEHRGVSAAELAHIRSDPADAPGKVPWRRLLPHRQTWAIALGKFLTDPIWWLYLFWAPDFFERNHGLDLKTMGPPIVAMYLLSDAGSIAGGWFSSWLIKRGWSVNGARKLALLVCALAVVPIVFAAKATNLWAAVGLMSLAMAAHQAWAANLFTAASDMFPRQAVGSVVGIGGMAGAIGGMLIALLVGQILQRTGSYVSIFIIAGSAYLVALLVIHFLAPRMEAAKV